MHICISKPAIITPTNIKNPNWCGNTPQIIILFFPKNIIITSAISLRFPLLVRFQISIYFKISDCHKTNFNAIIGRIFCYNDISFVIMLHYKTSIVGLAKKMTVLKTCVRKTLCRLNIPIYHFLALDETWFHFRNVNPCLAKLNIRILHLHSMTPQRERDSSVSHLGLGTRKWVVKEPHASPIQCWFGCHMYHSIGWVVGWGQPCRVETLQLGMTNIGSFWCSWQIHPPSAHQLGEN